MFNLLEKYIFDFVVSGFPQEKKTGQKPDTDTEHHKENIPK